MQEEHTLQYWFLWKSAIVFFRRYILASLRAKFHVGGMTWAVFTRVYLESCT